MAAERWLGLLLTFACLSGHPVAVWGDASGAGRKIRQSKETFAEVTGSRTTGVLEPAVSRGGTYACGPKNKLSSRQLQGEGTADKNRPAYDYPHRSIRIFPSVVNGSFAEQLRRKCRMLCESTDGGCNVDLEPCMGRSRERHADRLKRMTLEAEATSTLAQVSPADVAFVVFFAVGKRNAEAYPSHQFVQPDLNFIPVLQKTHPGSRIVILSDEHTPFDPDIGVEIWRVQMDSERLGRNAYANYYQYIGQKLFLQSLKANGTSQHIVFMDMDVLVLDSILEVFCNDYGYGLTINANEYDPVDIGLQFVQSQHYDEAIGFLQELIDRYLGLIGHPNSFTTGQVVMRNTLDMGHKDVMIPKIATAASKSSMHCRTVQGGKHRICFFPCLSYNYWEDCTDTVGVLPPPTVGKMVENRVKIMQFVAWRKPGLQPVAKAFLRGGLTAAYEAFEALPHTEAEYDKRFAYNTDVTRICYKDDAGCVGIRAGHVADNEKSLWIKPKQTE